MMKSLLKITLMMFAAAAIFQSCKEDPAAPTVLLDNTAISAKAGEQISIVATVTAPGGFSSLTIQKFWDDTEQGNPTEVTTLTGGAYTFTYTVTQEDVAPILKFRFTAKDGNDKSSTPVEAVVDVELTKAQLLVKYDWLITEEIRQKTGENDISDAYTDDVYRFNEDGTYQKSDGAKLDDFGDYWYNYCYYNLDEETGRLMMSRTGAFGEDVRDTIYITTIDADQIIADVTYYGLDAFNDGSQAVPYESSEDYVKKYASQSRSSNFDPYTQGAADDATGPAGYCNDVTW